MNKRLLVYLCILVSMVAGCTYPAQSTHEIDFDGTVLRQNESFLMDGQIEVDDGSGSDRNFSDVRIVLYDEEKEVIELEVVGSLSTDPSADLGSQRVNFTANTAPTYVLIKSDDFWKEGRGLIPFNSNRRLTVIAFRWDGKRYERYYIERPENRFINDSS